MEADSTILFDHQLADRLHKTVAEIHEMDHEEWVSWNAYIRREHQLNEMYRQARAGGR